MSSEAVSKAFAEIFEVWELLTKYRNMLLTVWDSEQDSWMSSGAVSKAFAEIFEVWELLTKYRNMLLTVWDSEQDP